MMAPPVGFPAVNWYWPSDHISRQEPQNLTRPTSKGCGPAGGCFPMNGLGAIPAGRYRGSVGNVMPPDNPPGSMQGRFMRDAIQGAVLRNAGIGSTAGQISCWGGRIGGELSSAFAFDTGDAGWDTALGIGSRIGSQLAQTTCSGGGSTTPSTTPSGSTPSNAAELAALRAETERIRLDTERLRLEQTQASLRAERRPTASTGIDWKTIGVGAAVVTALGLGAWLAFK